jgi:hypothetical protein
MIRPFQFVQSHVSHIHFLLNGVVQYFTTNNRMFSWPTMYWLKYLHQLQSNLLWIFLIIKYEAWSVRRGWYTLHSKRRTQHETLMYKLKCFKYPPFFVTYVIFLLRDFRLLMAQLSDVHFPPLQTTVFQERFNISLQLLGWYSFQDPFSSLHFPKHNYNRFVKGFSVYLRRDRINELQG